MEQQSNGKVYEVIYRRRRSFEWKGAMFYWRRANKPNSCVVS
jgi:hypothetical protein